MEKIMINQIYTREKSWHDFYDHIINTLPNPDIILRGKGADVSIYRHLTYDSHVDSCITSRESGLLSSEYEFVTAGTSAADTKAKDFINDVFNNHLDMNELLRYILECIYFGYGVQELIPLKSGSNIIYDKIIGLPAEWFGFDFLDNSLLFFSKEKPIEGEIVDMNNVNLIQYRGTYKNPYGEGKLARIFYPVSIKKAVMKYGADFAEKFGSVFLFLVTQSTDETKKKKALDMLFNMVQSGVGVIETSDELKELNVDKSGSSDLYTGLINLMNNEVSKAILGQTLTTENNTNTGSQAMATVHFDVRKEIIDSDKKFSCGIINKLIKRLVDMNMQVDNYPYLNFFEKETINLDRSTRDVNLQTLGVKPTLQYLEREYHFKPGDIEIVQTNPPVNNNPINQNSNNDSSVSFAEKKNFKSDVLIYSESGTVFQEDNQVEKFIENTSHYFTDALKPFYDELNKAIDKSENYDDAIKNILTANNIDLTKKIEPVGQCFLTADIIGRAYTILNRDDNVLKFAEINTPDINKPIWNYADIDFLKMKIPMTKDKYNELAKEYKNYAFTVSSYKREDDIEAALNHLIECKENKIGFEDWKKEVKEKNIYSGDMIYWQNVRAAQMSGKYKQMQEDVDIAPYWQYIAVVDKNTRPEHLALNGIIRRYDDPFWEKWYPPNGFRCRCTVRSLSSEYVKKVLGIDPSQFNAKQNTPTAEESINNIKNTQEGLSDKESAFYVQLEETKMKLPAFSGKNGVLNISPDKGFSNNVGKDLWNWTKAKESFTHSGWKNIIDNKIILSDILKDKKAYNLKPYEINKKLSKNDLTNNAINYVKNELKDILNDDMLVTDSRGSAVNFVNLEGFIKHIVEKEGQDRLRYLPALKDIILNPDTIIGNVMVANQKLKIQGFTKISKSYVKKVNLNGEDIFLCFGTNLTKYDKNYTGWTFYRVDNLKGISLK
jgi:SPP1 gp7 family putative phage head morphogenesis protein